MDKGIDLVHTAQNKPLPGFNLSTLLKYRNEKVLLTFMESFNISRNESEIIFDDMLRFLWVCQLHGEKPYLNVIDSPLIVIDEMWHTFILHTQAYDEFCKNYFGYFLHHQPTSKLETNKNKPRSLEKLIDEKRARYTMLYEILGKTVFIRWFHLYPKKYSKTSLMKLKK